MTGKPKYKIIGGSQAGKFTVPTADGMQPHPEAKPIKASDTSPVAQAARAEQAAEPDNGLRPVSFKFAEGTVTVYAPSGSSEDDILKELGLTTYERLNRDYETVYGAVEIYTGGK